MSFYAFCRFFTRLWAPMAYRVQYQGTENIPQRGGYILVSNHRSMADPVVIANRLDQQLFFMAKEELFQNPIAGWVLRHLGAFPVERGKGDTGAVEWAIDLLRQGDVLAMFPEGTRSTTQEPLRPKSGAAFIARATKADILPCCVVLEDKAQAKGRPRLIVRYGKMIPFEELGFSEEISPRELKSATNFMWDRVLTLLEEDRRED